MVSEERSRGQFWRRYVWPIKQCIGDVAWTLWQRNEIQERGPSWRYTFGNCHYKWRLNSWDWMRSSIDWVLLEKKRHSRVELWGTPEFSEKKKSQPRKMRSGWWRKRETNKMERPESQKIKTFLRREWSTTPNSATRLNKMLTENLISNVEVIVGLENGGLGSG